MPIYKTRTLVSAATAIMLACTAGQASAINLVLNFDASSSDSPAFDSDGSQLTAIMEAAAAYWEGIILDTQTITVNFMWDDLSANGIGLHNGDSFNGNVETEMTLWFDTTTSGGVTDDRNWFFDPTPADNSEFNLQTQLYRDLPAANQVGGANAWYRGNPQDHFEVAHQGGWVGTNQGIDLFTVALHEIGHGLGMTSDNATTMNQVNTDFDYDLPASLTDGANIDVVVSGTGSNNALVHISPTNALMFPSYQTGRALPSATDVFAMAAVSGWSQIDLPRKYFASGSSFHFAGNWIGNRVPDSFDDVFILGGNTPVLTNTTFLNSLTIEDGNGIDVDDEILFTLEDTNLAAVPGGGGARPAMEVGTGGLASVAGDLNVAGGLLLLTGGEVEVGGVLRFNDVDGLLPAIVGKGTVRVFSQISGDADYTATQNGTLEIKHTGSFENLWINREIRATSGNITFTDFDSVELREGSNLIVGAGRTATISNLDSDTFISFAAPQIDLIGSTTNSPLLVLTGNEATINAEVNVNRTARIQGDARWLADSDVQLPDPEDVLILDGLTRLLGASFTGEGRLVQRGDLRVDSNTTIDTNIYDWDGDSSASNTTIDPYTTFVINSSQIDLNPGSDGYDGVVTNFGRLEVNTYLLLQNPFTGEWIQVNDAWRLDAGGVLVMDASAGGTPQLAGSGVEVFGTVDVFDGLSQSLSFFALEPGGVVNINDPGASLQFNALTRLRGGIIIGPGTLINNGELLVDADMSIDTAGFNWSGSSGSSITIGAGSDLLITSSSLGGGNPYLGTMTIQNAGRLLVNATNTGPWSNNGLIQINGGETVGQWFTNNANGEVRGHGSIRGTTHVNDGLIAAGNGQTLELATNSVPDLDGTSGNGRIEAIDGDIFIRRLLVFAPAGTDFHGSVEVGPGRTFQINDSMWFNLHGEMVSNGGTIDIADFANAGVLRGTATVVQPYTQTSAGTLAFDIAGTTPGSFDRIIFLDTVSLDGVLEVSLDGGFIPSVGDSFDILDFNALSGSFASLNLPAIGAGLVWDDSDLLSTGVLWVVAGGLPGDTDGDGDIDDADLGTSFSNYTGPVGAAGNKTAAQGDTDGDGDVDDADLGTSFSGYTGPLVGPNNVPEPATITLLALGGLALTRRRKRVNPRTRPTKNSPM